jgi:hypothetical protein
MSEYVELCNHMIRRHGVDSPANWAAKLSPEKRLPAVKRAHANDHADYLKFPKHPQTHHESDLSL